MPPAASWQRSSALDTGRGGKDREVDVRLFAVFAFALSPDKQGPFNRQPKWESLAGVHFRAWRELSFPSLPCPSRQRSGPLSQGEGAPKSPRVSRNAARGHETQTFSRESSPSWFEVMYSDIIPSFTIYFPIIMSSLRFLWRKGSSNVWGEVGVLGGSLPARTPHDRKRATFQEHMWVSAPRGTPDCARCFSH